MLNKKAFEKIRKELKEFDNKRENIIRISRDILRASKSAIYSVHREDMKEALSLIKKAGSGIKKVKTDIKNNQKLGSIGLFGAALQEYAEAVCYYEYIKTGKVPVLKDVDTENYLLGLCDLTGELARRVVASAIKKDFDAINKMKSVVEDIYNEFLKFNLRNSELRKKSDSIKWNLQKIEDVVYDLGLRGI